MPKIISSEKVCNQCGSNVRYINPTGTQEFCYSCHLARMKLRWRTDKGKVVLDRARQKERDNLTNNYIRQYLYISIYNSTGVKIVRKDITLEQVERQREALKTSRKLKERVNQSKSKNYESEQTKTK